MKSFLTILFGLFISSSSWAQTSPPSGAVYQSQPYAGANYFTTAQCITERFACKPDLSRDQMVAKANSCAAASFGLINIMGELGSVKNGYKGCVLPTSYKDEPGAPLSKKWAVCCIAPTKNGNGTCTFDCHLYYNNN